MKMQEIKEFAEKNGIVLAYTKYTKEKLIREIQEKEGNDPCFKTRSECFQVNCLWRADCIH